MTGIVSDIKRFAIHDGPGIRTTLFLKGCPLRCLWCHNPENLDKKPALAYTEKLCVGCGDCAVACPCGCHKMEKPTICRDNCTACGACADACMPGALKIYGKETEAARAAELLLEDAAFYGQSGGGVTFSGGEPLLQADFCAEAMQIIKKQGVHIAVDTCGEAPWGAFEAVLPYTDIFLYDIKHIEPQIHRKWTGAPCMRIIDNLKELDTRGVPCELRIPVIPGFNGDDETMLSLGTFAAAFSNVTCVRLLAYHNLSGVKYDAIGLADKMPATAPPPPRRMEELRGLLNRVCADVRLSGDL